MENKQHEEFLQSQPTKEEYEAIAKQIAAKRNELKKHSMELETQKTDLQDEVDMLNYQHEQYMNARKAENDEQHKLDLLKKESTYLNTQLSKDSEKKKNMPNR